MLSWGQYENFLLTRHDDVVPEIMITFDNNVTMTPKYRSIFSIGSLEKTKT